MAKRLRKGHRPEHLDATAVDEAWPRLKHLCEADFLSNLLDMGLHGAAFQRLPPIGIERGQKGSRLMQIRTGSPPTERASLITVSGELRNCRVVIYPLPSFHAVSGMHT